MRERVWQYQDLSGVHTITDGEILREFYPLWSDMMKKAGKEKLISEENCIEDFVVVHWASRVGERIHE